MVNTLEQGDHTGLTDTTQTSRMVADVGGTNTRLALFDPTNATFRSLSTYINREYRQLEDIIANWVSTLSEPVPQACCIAVAAPPSGDLVVMTNMDWSFSCKNIAARFGFRQLRRLNDFEANAYALPHLTSGDHVNLYSGKPDQIGRLATIGPGTGLGGAFLARIDGIAHSFACEPGYVGLTPGNRLELDIFRLLQPVHRHLYAELLVSGPGLARLHQALGEIRGERADPLDPAEISRLALADEDRLCVQTLQTFCELLGSICGDFLLANGSYGGLYLAGGIVPRLIKFIDNTAFRQRMVEKGAMQERLTEVPVYVITTDHPGLIGAAHAPQL